MELEAVETQFKQNKEEIMRKQEEERNTMQDLTLRSKD